MGLPNAVASAASLTASDSVGCPWHVRARSSVLAPYSIASTHSWIISPALGPMMCAPSSLSVSAQAIILTTPSASSTARARELAMKENFPVFTWCIRQCIQPCMHLYVSGRAQARSMARPNVTPGRGPS
eukprot:250502-Chlamydomonas_euryale.AAC.23